MQAYLFRIKLELNIKDACAARRRLWDVGNSSFFDHFAIELHTPRELCVLQYACDVMCVCMYAFVGCWQQLFL
jgi:hypothetical protein